MHKYHVYDVFTETAFGGNQLAVFPDARKIPEQLLQSIAAEFNFSEVTFVYPPKDKSNTAHVRIFTPTMEIDFAGHPIIGTLYALADLGENSPMTLELGVGPLECVMDERGATFATSAKLKRLAAPDSSLVAAALGLPDDAIEQTTHAPLQLTMGLPFIVTELKSRQWLAACQANHEKIREGAQLYREGQDFALFAYHRRENTISSRMFAPLDQIPEDPATGSASATLAALLTELLDAPQNLVFSQGEDMGRPSRISIETTQKPLRVMVTGKAVHIMTGCFFAG